MPIAVVLLAALAQSNSPGAAAPPPDFAALMPAYPKEGLTAQQHAEWLEHAEDVETRVKFLRDAWASLAGVRASPEFTRLCVWALHRLDFALNQLKPKPSAAEAEARLRAYGAVVELVAANLRRAETRGEAPPGSGVGIWRVMERLGLPYQPLLSRSE
jgi:hypothetical protein